MSDDKKHKHAEVDDEAVARAKSKDLRDEDDTVLIAPVVAVPDTTAQATGMPVNNPTGIQTGAAAVPLVVAADAVIDDDNTRIVTVDDSDAKLRSSYQGNVMTENIASASSAPGEVVVDRATAEQLKDEDDE